MFWTAIKHVFSSNTLLTPWMQGMTSKPTSPSESPLLFNPWNQLNSHVTGFGNTQASRGRWKSPSSTHNKNVHYSADVLICGTSTVLITSGYHAVTYI